MRFPIVPFEEGAKIPDENCYVVGQNGIFVRKVGLIESLAPIGGVSGLQTVQPYVRLNTGKIPFAQFCKVILFFRAVYARHQSEAIVMLFHSKTRDEFLVYAPPQEVGYGHVNYAGRKPLDGYIQLGTMHSHGDSAAFASNEDRRDEFGSYGLHLIVGRINEPFLDINAHITVRGGSVHIPPENVIDGIQQKAGSRRLFGIDPARAENFTELTFPKKWFGRVKPFKPPVPRWLVARAERCKHGR